MYEICFYCLLYILFFLKYMLNIIVFFNIMYYIYIYIDVDRTKINVFPCDTDDEMHSERTEFRDLQCGPSLLRHAKGHWPNLRHPTTQTNKITAVFRSFLL